MHAVVATVEIEAGKGEEATAALQQQVAPQVKQSPGFVSGTWARSTDGKHGHGVVLFESKEAAEAAAANLQQQGPPPGAPVKVVCVQVDEVLAQA